MCNLQVKQNQEIKKLQEDFIAIQEKLGSNIDEINEKISRELSTVNDKLAFHMLATNAQMNSKLTDIKQVSELIEEQTEKIHAEAKMIKEQNTVTWTSILKEIQVIEHNLTDARTIDTNAERTQQNDNNQSTISFTMLPKETRPERNLSSPRTSNNVSSIHSQSVEVNNHQIKTVVLPSPKTAPIFHGKPSECPGPFLICVEEYTETVHVWGEDMLHCKKRVE
jgi:hypothetical protein